MNIPYYFKESWNTPLFVSELFGGFLVVVLLTLPMFFVPLFKFKNSKSELAITLILQSLGVTIGIILAKTVGDFMLKSPNPDDFGAIGIGNSSGTIFLAFEFMSFTGLPYLLGASLLGGILGALVSLFICKLYNNRLSKEDRQDLSFIFSQPDRSFKTLLKTELIFVPIWFLGIAGIMGTTSVDWLLRNLTVSIEAIILLICAMPFGFFVLALNFNISKWLIGGIFLKNFSKRSTAQISLMTFCTAIATAGIGSIFYGLSQY